MRKGSKRRSMPNVGSFETRGAGFAPKDLPRDHPARVISYPMTGTWDLADPGVPEILLKDCGFENRKTGEEEISLDEAEEGIARNFKDLMTGIVMMHSLMKNEAQHAMRTGRKKPYDSYPQVAFEVFEQSPELPLMFKGTTGGCGNG